MASEVAYYTYIYAKISREKYQQVTGNTRAAILLGRFLSGVISQVLVSTGAMNVRDLNYITLGSKYAVCFDDGPLLLALPAARVGWYKEANCVPNWTVS